MEFKRLGEVTLVEEAVDTANVLIEENGEIKRVPKTEVGGMGFPTAIIKDSEYDNAIAGVQTMSSAGPAITYECLNMTFEEAYEIMSSGEILNVIGMVTMSGNPVIVTNGTIILATSHYGVPCILIMSEITLFWTADGISTDEPSSGR